MLSKILFVMTVAAVAVNAQGDSSTAAPTTTAAPISACILACVEPAATQNGCAFTDASCICTSAQFQADAGACLQEHCTAADLQAAMALQTAQCAAAGLSATGSATPSSVPFTLASSAAAPASSAATTTKPAATTPSASATKPATASGASATPSASKAAAESVLANGAGAIFGALLAGVLAL